MRPNAAAIRRPVRSALLRTPVLFVLAIYFLFNCHLLRNLTPVYYGVLAIAFSAAIVYSLSKMSSLSMTPIGIWLLAYLLFALSAAIQTLVDLGPVPAAYGGVRLLMTFPLVALVFLVSGTYPRIFEYALWLFLGFAMIGVFSVIIQYFTGPISWFVEASDRAGMERFGSFLGSIPTIGAVVPLGILLILLIPMKPPVRIGLLLVMGAGIFSSLSKQAISGSFLAIVLGLLLGKKKRVAVVAWIIAGSALGYLLMDWLDLPLISSMKNYVTGILFPNAAGAVTMRGYDFTVQESMWMRMTSLPMHSYDWLLEHRGPYGMLIGGGCMMLGPSLLRPGDSHYFTAHNNYMDFVLLGGIGYLLAFVGLCVALVRESLRLYKSKTAGGVGAVMLGLSLMYVTASMFTGGLTYQPALGTLWWTLVGFAWRSEVNKSMESQRGAIPAVLRFRPRSREASRPRGLVNHTA
ncbi:MAG TPA: hypothetical protein VGL53_27220 [Bryobacteraceae bacterium]|jgi:hypothetical protein